MTTQQNLARGLEEEARNRELYLAFADKADADGQHQLAKLFRATAESELVHARTQIRELGLVGTSLENVRYAVAAEEREFQDSYAGYLREAHEEGNERAAVMFSQILKVERTHHRMFSEAAAALLANQPLLETGVYVCQKCGNTVVGDRPGACEFCGQAGGTFREIT